MAKETLNIVSLRRVAYSDRHAIVTAWSRERGCISLLANDGAGRAAARIRALTTPPSVAECVADIRPGKEIHSIGQLRTSSPLISLRDNPLKGMVAMFLAEVMATVLPQSSPDERVFDFIVASLRLLDAEEDAMAMANFHLWFLYRLGCYLGIEPDVATWEPGRMLDMRDGTFRRALPPHVDILTPEQSDVAAKLSRMTSRNLSRWRFSRIERAAVLDLELRYMAIHLAPGLASLRSLEVLRTLL